MQKKMIVMALAAVIATPAFADTANVNVYGAVNLSAESIDMGDSLAGAKGSKQFKVSSNVTKLGFKGAQDLGDGVSAIFQIEQQIDVDDTSATGAKSTFATRNSFVGLEDKTMGTLQLGYMDTPYKVSTRALDAFADSLADNRTLMGGVKGFSAAQTYDARSANGIFYTSPDMGGLKLAVAYIAGAEANSATTVNQGSATSFAAMYNAGDLSANVGYEVHNLGTNNSGTVAVATAGTDGQKETAARIGVGYKIGSLYLSAVYETMGDTFTSTAKYDHSAAYVSAKYDLSNTNTVKVAYTKAGEVNGVQDTGATQMSLGFDHKLAKATSVYVLYTSLTNGDAAKYNLTNAGSTGGGTAVAGAGSKESAIALGMKHAF
jgi:predicted porin